MNPFSAELPGMFSSDQREVVADVGAVEKLIDGRLKEEWLAESECCGCRDSRNAKSHRSVWHAGGNDSVARAVLARIGKVGFVQHGV